MSEKWWKDNKVPQPSSKFFQGELMTCEGCHGTQRSDPKVNLNWTVIELPGRVEYWCPDCFAALLLRSKH